MIRWVAPRTFSSVLGREKSRKEPPPRRSGLPVNQADFKKNRPARCSGVFICFCRRPNQFAQACTKARSTWQLRLAHARLS